MMVQGPRIVDWESGVNDLLDRDRSRTPIEFHISNALDTQVVQTAPKWKRIAREQFECHPGEGVCTDSQAWAFKV